MKRTQQITDKELWESLVNAIKNTVDDLEENLFKPETDLVALKLRDEPGTYLHHAANFVFVLDELEKKHAFHSDHEKFLESRTLADAFQFLKTNLNNGRS